MAFADSYRGRRVLVTGHTGFKGAWLSEWLLGLGAKVIGLALPPPTTPSLFEQLELAARIQHHVLDVRDLAGVEQLIERVQPEFVFHLAAQPLVRLSYEQPVETYATNIMGLVHVLDAVRRANQPCTVVAITTDKCYENRECLHGYRETDPMGGHDPYSSSKGAAELVLAAYRRSFFEVTGSRVGLASARAGNVIGGGDWALDRIVPDCVRALREQRAIPVRNKIATRPWQHVLEPLSGYLWLGALLAGAPSMVPRTDYASAFNFGPSLASNRTVADLVREVLRHWPGKWEDRSDPHAAHEATRLNLTTDKAFHLLRWQPVWEFPKAVAQTIRWYRDVEVDSAVAGESTRQQIGSYEADARGQGLPWAC